MKWALPFRIYAPALPEATRAVSERQADSMAGGTRSMRRSLSISEGDDRARAAHIEEYRAKRGFWPTQDLSRFYGPEGEVKGRRVEVGKA